MTAIETRGEERLMISAHGAETVCLTVTHPRFGRLASIRLDHRQAAQLANALDERLVDAAGGVSASSEG